MTKGTILKESVNICIQLQSASIHQNINRLWPLERVSNKEEQYTKSLQLGDRSGSVHPSCYPVFLLSNAKVSKELVQDIFYIDGASDPPQFRCRQAQFFCSHIDRHTPLTT
jgi:hypothetical protein